MEATITVRMDNAAFDPDAGAELARILRDLADNICDRVLFRVDDADNLRDYNGNTVGQIEFTED